MIATAFYTLLTSRSGLVVGGAITLSAFAFYSGASWQHDRCQAKFAAQREALMQQLQNEQTRASLQYEAEKAHRAQTAQTITKEVNRVVKKTVYQSGRIDPDGLRLLQSAIHQAKSTSQPN